MKYFFMTASSSSEQDYTWWKFYDQKLEKTKLEDLPKLSVDSYPNFFDWLDGDPTHFSLLLAQDAREAFCHFLVICNLETDRQDHQRRMIRNSIVLLSENSEDIQTIRRLAAAALDDVLRQETAKMLDSALKQTPSTGMDWLSFDEKSWSNFLDSEKLKNQETEQATKKNICPFIAKDSNENRESLRVVLLGQDNLPNKVIIVIVTGFKKPEFFQKRKDKICFVLTEIEPSKERRTIVEKIGNYVQNAPKKLIKSKNAFLSIFVFLAVVGRSRFAENPAASPVVNCHLSPRISGGLSTTLR